MAERSKLFKILPESVSLSGVGITALDRDNNVLTYLGNIDQLVMLSTLRGEISSTESYQHIATIAKAVEGSYKDIAKLRGLADSILGQYFRVHPEKNGLIEIGLAIKDHHSSFLYNNRGLGIWGKSDGQGSFAEL